MSKITLDDFNSLIQTALIDYNQVFPKVAELDEYLSILSREIFDVQDRTDDLFLEDIDPIKGTEL